MVNITSTNSTFGVLSQPGHLQIGWSDILQRHNSFLPMEAFVVRLNSCVWNIGERH